MRTRTILLTLTVLLTAACSTGPGAPSQSTILEPASADTTASTEPAVTTTQPVSDTFGWPRADAAALAAAFAGYQGPIHVARAGADTARFDMATFTRDDAGSTLSRAELGLRQDGSPMAVRQFAQVDGVEYSRYDVGTDTADPDSLDGVWLASRPEVLSPVSLLSEVFPQLTDSVDRQAFLADVLASWDGDTLTLTSPSARVTATVVVDAQGRDATLSMEYLGGWWTGTVSFKAEAVNPPGPNDKVRTDASTDDLMAAANLADQTGVFDLWYPDVAKATLGTVAELLAGAADPTSVLRGVAAQGQPGWRLVENAMSTDPLTISWHVGEETVTLAADGFDGYCYAQTLPFGSSGAGTSQVRFEAPQGCDAASPVPGTATTWS